MRSAEIAIPREAGAIGDADPLAFSIARILLVTILIGAPWAFGAVDSSAWMSLGLVVCVILLLWAVGSVQQGALKFFWSPLYIPLALFLVFGLVQYGARLSFDISETRQALVLLATDLALFFVTIQLFARARRETWRRFGLTVLLLAGSLGLFAILQFAAGEQKIYGQFDTGGSGFFGPYVDPDHFAGLMEMLLPVAILYLAEPTGKPKVAVLAPLSLVAALAVAALLLSGSRGGLLALLAEIVIALALVGRGGRRIAKRGLGAAIAAVVLAATLLFFWVDPGWVWKRLALVADVGGGPAWAELADFRKTMVLDSLRMWRDHPLLGVGLGDFGTAYPRYQSFPSDLWIDYVHDDYVQAIAETGAVGAVLILAALALFSRLAFRDLGQRLRSGGSLVQLGAALGCCGLLVHSFFDFNLHIPANAAWFAVLAGIATTMQQPTRARMSQAQE